MNIRFLIPLFSLLGLAWNVLADGIPFDRATGKITTPHSFLTLSESQKEELDCLGTVTLDSRQWADLRKISPSTPKRLRRVLPETWNDCTCGIQYDAIRLKDGRIAILHRSQKVETIRWRIDSESHLTFQVDSRGQFHLEGTLLRFPLLMEAIRTSTPVSQRRIPSENRVRIQVPVGMSFKDKVFEDRIVEVYRAFAAKGWNEGKTDFYLIEVPEIPEPDGP